MLKRSSKSVVFEETLQRAGKIRGVLTIYKICPASAWREATGKGLPGQCRTICAMDHFILSASQVAEDGEAETSFLQENGLFLIAVDCRCARRGAAWELSARRSTCFRTLWRTDLVGHRGHGPARASDGIMEVRELEQDPRLRTFSLPLLRWFDPETHRSGDQGPASVPPIRPRAALDPSSAVRAFGLNSQPHRLVRASTRDAEVQECGAAGGSRLCRNGHSDAVSRQTGNPRPRLVRMDRDERHYQPAGLQTITAAERGAAAARARAHLGGIVGVMSAHKEVPRTLDGRVVRRSDLCTGGRLFSPSTCLSHDAGFEQSAAGGRAGRSVARGDRSARPGPAERRPYDGVPQVSRARSQPGRSRRRGHIARSRRVAA